MKRVLTAGIVILTGLSCKKDNIAAETKTPAIPSKCGILLTTPVLDSFEYPTCYISAFIAFPEGKEVVHFQYKVTGAHDGSWFLNRYNKDSSFCTTP